MRKAGIALLMALMITMLFSCGKPDSSFDDIPDEDPIQDTDNDLQQEQDKDQAENQDQEQEREHGFKFELVGDAYYVSGVYEGWISELIVDAELVIPSEYNGKSVVGMADKAFEGVIRFDRYNESTTEGYITVRISEGIRFIGKRAFSACTGLRAISLPSTLTEIGAEAFRGSSLLSLDMTDGVSDIGEKAFYDCRSLESVVLSDSIRQIPVSVFEGCERLTKVENTDKLTDIAENAFFKCKKLEGFEFGDSLLSIGKKAFYGCASLSEVILPDSLTSLGEAAFSSCTGAERLHIGGGISEIPESAFRYMSSLKSVVIPDNITEVSRGAFDNLSNLKELTISKSVTCFNYCFNHTSAIESIYYEGTLEDWLKIFFYSVGSSPLYYSGSAKLYLDGELLEGALVIPEGITEIPAHAFENYSYITSVSFPYDMEYIGDAAFYWCQGITEVSFGGDVADFGTQIFYGCKRIVSVDFGTKLSKIGSGMFSDCIGLDRVVIPSSVRVIENYAFASCDIGELILSEGLEEIRSSAFQYGTIPEVRLPSTVKSIGTAAFSTVGEIYYNGTAEEWQNVEKYTQWNMRYDEYYVHCIDADVYYAPYYSRY